VQPKDFAQISLVADISASGFLSGMIPECEFGRFSAEVLEAPAAAEPVPALVDAALADTAVRVHSTEASRAAALEATMTFLAEKKTNRKVSLPPSGLQQRRCLSF
jgi:hypothetical protein